MALIKACEFTDGRVFRLLTLVEFKALPVGTKLVCINGKRVVKRADTSTDTRCGYVAYGLESPKKAGIQ